jgi:hypothetical protein
MAITLLDATGKRRQGLSSDVKPLTDVEEGTTFHVVDTGAQYIFHDGMWEPDRRLLHALQSL